MTSYPMTPKSRAAALTAVMRKNPPKLRFTRGMAKAAARLDKKAK